MFFKLIRNILPIVFYCDGSDACLSQMIFFYYLKKKEVIISRLMSDKTTNEKLRHKLID